MATKTEVLSELAQKVWLDMTVLECRDYAIDFGFAHETPRGIVIVDLAKAEEHFIESWVDREWDAQDD